MTVDLHHLPDAEPLWRPELPEINRLDWHLSDPGHIGSTPHFEITKPKSSSEEEEPTDG